MFRNKKKACAVISIALVVALTVAFALSNKLITTLMGSGVKGSDEINVIFDKDIPVAITPSSDSVDGGSASFSDDGTLLTISDLMFKDKNDSISYTFRVKNTSANTDAHLDGVLLGSGGFDASAPITTDLGTMQLSETNGGFVVVGRTNVSPNSDVPLLKSENLDFNLTKNGVLLGDATNDARDIAKDSSTTYRLTVTLKELKDAPIVFPSESKAIPDITLKFQYSAKTGA